MTGSKVIDRLLKFTPAVVDPAGPACILTTAIGIDVLAAFGIRAEPFSCRVRIVNEGRCIDIGHPDATGPGWTGHLMIQVPARDVLIDLDLKHYRRPAPHRLILPDNGVFAWPAGSTLRRYELPGQHGGMEIQATPENNGYVQARDWWAKDKRAPFVSTLVRAIRKGRIKGDA